MADGWRDTHGTRHTPAWHEAQRRKAVEASVEDARLDPANSAAFVASLRKLPRSSRDQQLVASAQRNQPNLVKCLLAAEANIETTWGPEEATVLILACQMNADRAVVALLEAGANVKARTSRASGAKRRSALPQTAAPSQPSARCVRTAWL